MNTNNVVDMIDEEIIRLTQARNLLAESPIHLSITQANGHNMIANKARTGRKLGSKNKPKVPAKKVRNMSPAGRERIVEAVRQRWARQKEATTTAETAKSAPKPSKKTAAKKATPGKKNGKTKVAVDGPIPTEV